MSIQTQELPAIASRYAGIVPNGEPEVPAEIELYLAELSASAAEWTRAMELASDGTGAGAQYLERAGARAGAHLTMMVEERSGDAPGTEEQVQARLIAAFRRPESCRPIS